MQALKVLEQNSHDSRNRAIGMTKGSNLALVVNSVEEVIPQESYRASWSMTYPEDLEHHYHDHMAFHAKTFWIDPSKAKEDNIKRNNSRGPSSSGPRTRSCYNCNDKCHFIAECPYENRETHGGRLIPKDKSKDSKGKYSKPPNKKFYNKNKKGKRPSRIVLVTKEEYSSDEIESASDDEEESSREVDCFMARSTLDTSIVLSTQEEYTSGDEDVDDEEDATSNGLVALASLSTNSSSTSESPNEVIHVEEESCLMAKSSEDYAAGGSKWVLDSGCTTHMTGGKNLVKELRPNINHITVSFGDNSTSEVLGFGKVVVAHNITLVDVMLVKTLGYNLLSVSALGKMGFAVFIDNDIVVLLWSKTLKVAFVGYREHNLYVVDFSGTTTTSAMCLFGKADVGWLWHRRLAHTKDETQQIFIDFATEVQRQHNLLIMAIRSDNGSEFKNYTLNDFLSDEGIRHQYSAAYTPQQNGVAERKNRTLMDMARSMMAEYKSRYNLWAEAISIACHSSNRLYLRKGLNKTPYEILTGNKPNISYFKVFGCKCFYKIKGVRLSKFAPKALEGIFVGYGAESHTYRIFDIASGIIIESSSVRFEENDGSQVGQVDVCAGDEIPQDSMMAMFPSPRINEVLPPVASAVVTSTTVAPTVGRGTSSLRATARPYSPVRRPVASGRMIATGNFFHIQPSTYRPASSPLKHAWMVPIGSINLFVGLAGVSDPSEPRPSRSHDPFAPGQLLTATRPVTGEVYAEAETALEDDAESAIVAPTANSTVASAAADSADAAPAADSADTIPAIDSVIAAIDADFTDILAITSVAESAVASPTARSVATASTKDSISLVSHPSDFEGGFEDDSILSLFGSDYDSDSVEAPRYCYPTAVFMAGGKKSSQSTPSPLPSLQPPPQPRSRRTGQPSRSRGKRSSPKDRNFASSKMK
ncbi:hypothetical protein QYE76_023781 [Lolium multiflorum]|uniref:Integrase catalytic domain-containing protein n=1 Tax=Lolium multiflorum TaxID=4521 RepID=A0AAD8RDW9_LOLMU|nr:hypothetical protein QYE76_023781 [Lolium multiflorum]